jgi:hypothetical protein
MTLRLALCFLFHQPLGEHAERANRICYRGLLDVLRNHPRSKFNLMLSGTLLDALAWFDPAFFDAVRSGLRDGRFRLLGSTYAQSLLLAVDDGDAARQIAVHRAALKNFFDAEPPVFWSPQQVWAPRLAPLLIDAGYRLLALDGDALRAAGAAAPRTHRLASPAGDLTALWCDARLRDRMDFAAWFRRNDVLKETLDGWKNDPDVSRLFPAFTEHAGAFGLWGYDAGLDPRADLDGLDGLLDWIENGQGIESAFLEQAPAPADCLSLSGAVRGRFLDRALSDPEVPLHEEGYRDWDDFLARAPRLQHFRLMHNAVRVRMASAPAALSAARESSLPEESQRAGAALWRLAERVYCAHQDRFGWPGAGGRGDPAWEGIGAAIAVSKAAELACAPARAAVQGLIDDLTGDGEDEILLRSGDQMAVLSPYGGRLLHWVDLRRGQLLVGNPLAVPVGSLLIVARSPDFAPMPDDWLPGEADPPPVMHPEGGERRLVWLAKENLPADPGPLPVWPRPLSAALKPSLPVRRHALNDFLSLDDGPEEKPEPRLDFRLADGAATFLRFFGYRLRMVKRVSLTAGGVRAIYRFRNVNSRAVRVRLRLVSEVCPDYQAVLDVPGRPFEPVTVGPRHSPGIKNVRTGTTLVSHLSRPESQPSVPRPGILAWEVEQAVSFTVDPGRTELIVVRLALLSDKQAAAGASSASTM